MTRMIGLMAFTLATSRFVHSLCPKMEEECLSSEYYIYILLLVRNVSSYINTVANAPVMYERRFWNCAELKISSECDGPEVTTTSTTTTTSSTSTSVSTSNGTGATVTTSATLTTSSTTTQSNQGGETCAAATGVCGPNNPCGKSLWCIVYLI